MHHLALATRRGRGRRARQQSEGKVSNEAPWISKKFHFFL
jgi:hypothetical protein